MQNRKLYINQIQKEHDSTSSGPEFIYEVQSDEPSRGLTSETSKFFSGKRGWNIPSVKGTIWLLSVHISKLGIIEEYISECGIMVNPHYYNSQW